MDVNKTVFMLAAVIKVYFELKSAALLLLLVHFKDNLLSSNLNYID